jgi:hypothetical protein
VCKARLRRRAGWFMKRPLAVDGRCSGERSKRRDGHVDIVTTMRYVHATAGKHRAVELLRLDVAKNLPQRLEGIARSEPSVVIVRNMAA